MPEMMRRGMDLQVFAEGDPKPGSGFSAEYVQDLRNENAAWRTKLRTAEDELAKAKTQIDELSKKVTGLEGQNKSQLDEIRQALKLDASAKLEDVITKIKESATKSNVSVEKAQEALRKASFMTSAIKHGIPKEVLEDAYKLADFSSVKVDLESTSVFPVDKDGKQLTKDGKPITDLDSLVETMVKEKPFLVAGTKSGSIGSPSKPGGTGNLSPEEEGRQLAELRIKARKEQAGGGFNPWATDSK